MIGCCGSSGKFALQLACFAGADAWLHTSIFPSCRIRTGVDVVAQYGQTNAEGCRATEMDVTMIGLQNAGKTSLLRVLAVCPVHLLISGPGLTIVN